MAKRRPTPQRRYTLATILALLLLAVIPAFPFLQSGFPRTNDLLPHLHRTFALDQMVRLGYLWPRWSIHLVHGFGYPVFNFFPSLSHWVIELWHLIGLSLTNGYRATVYAHFALTALTSFLLGRDVTRTRRGGWTLAVLYTLSPYLLYDAIVRGSPPESQAIALLPLLVLGIRRLLEASKGPSLVSPKAAGGSGLSAALRLFLAELTQAPFWFAVTALTYAAMILSHPAVTLLISVMLLLWFILHAATIRPESTHGRFLQRLWPLTAPLLALLLGGLLTAFSSLPAVLELDATRAELSISQGYTYERNLLPLDELFSLPVIPADPARINPPVVRSLPLLALAWLAITLPLTWSRLVGDQRRTIVQFILLLLLAIWLITPSSRWVWDNFPLLHFTLFPWRLLAWVSLSAALPAALTTAALGQDAPQKKSGGQNSWRHLLRRGQFAVLLLTILVTIGAVPWLFPPRETIETRITQAVVSGSETPPFLIGTTTLGEYLPRDVTQLPDTAALRAQLVEDGSVDRLLPPEGVTWLRQTTNPLDERYLISTDGGATLTYRQFYFPGWRVEIDGQETAITPSTPDGLITVSLPAGSHEVRFVFGTTPLRTVSSVISLLAVLLLGLLYHRGLLIGGKRRGDLAPLAADEQPGPLILTAGLTALAVFAFFALVDTPLRRPTLQPDGLSGLPADRTLDFAGELRMLTYTQSAEMITAGEPLELTTYWQPLRGIGVDYVFGVQVVDERGITWQRTVERPFDWRFVAGGDIWPKDQYRLEPFVITLLDGAPPGKYKFLIGLVRRDTGQTVVAHEFGGFEVTAPQNEARPLEDGMVPLRESAAGLTLLGSRTDRDEARPGDPVRVALLWQIDDPAVALNNFTLRLMGEDGTVFLEQAAPIAASYPPENWGVGDRLRSEMLLRLPAGTADGRLIWQVTWGGREIPLQTIVISAPERVFNVPAPDISIDTRLGEIATLLGADLVFCDRAEGIPCEVGLYWRSEQETPISYRVFVHLVDEDGGIVAQADGEPAGWNRPTTGWLPGEVIIDPYELAVAETFPVGRYTLRVGLYNPFDGQRLTTPQGLDGVVIASFEMK